MSPQQPVLDVTLERKEPTPAALPATQAPADPALAMIERACLDPNFDVSKLQALMDMREREMRRVAEQAFNAAMAGAQAEMRAIAADSYNAQTRSNYASYAAMDRMARPIYTKHGLALSFNSQESKLADHVLVLCYVTHGGYTRTYQADMPADGKGAKGGDVMTKTHATGSAFSYAQRYLLRLIFNLAVDEDDDGNKAGKQQDREIVAPEGFEDWFLDMDAGVLAGMDWAKWSKSWNDSKEIFRIHLAKTNPGKIGTWKKTAKENTTSAAKESK